MAHTTETLAADLKVTERQVLNYKKAVESHLGIEITYRQGRNFFYFEEYVPFLRLVQKGQGLPEVEREPEIEIIEPESPVIGGGQLLLRTRVIDAPEPIASVPLELTRIDSRAIDAQTHHNQQQQETLMQQIRASVLNEAEAFGEELKAEVKQTVSRAVAEGYQDLLKT